MLQNAQLYPRHVKQTRMHDVTKHWHGPKRAVSKQTVLTDNISLTSGQIPDTSLMDVEFPEISRYLRVKLALNPCESRKLNNIQCGPKKLVDHEAQHQIINEATFTHIQMSNHATLKVNLSCQQLSHAVPIYTNRCTSTHKQLEL